MICALLIGREGSSGFPGKNVYPVLGRPLAAYPMKVALSCPSVQRLYVSTDSAALAALGRSLGAEIIDRPPRLASKAALGEHAFVHGYEVICSILEREGAQLEMLVLLFANAPTVTPITIEQGITAMRADPLIDSAVTVSSYNMWSPLRARRINANGLLDPFVPFESFGDPRTLNCDRDSQGDVWFADMGASIVRPRCLDQLEEGLLPQKWMGRRILPLKQWGGLDVDEPWQIPAIEAWLQSHQVDRLFRVHRTKWSQFYDSERGVLSLLQLDPRTSVLDVGADPGGLGLALKERFEVTNYSALVSNDAQGREVKAINPAAEILIGKDGGALATEGRGYDLVVALGTDDDSRFYSKGLTEAFEHVALGGTLVLTLRLTGKDTIEDIAASFQDEIGPAGRVYTHPYIVRSTLSVIERLKNLHPARIRGYGYSGNPSSTARTPLKVVCFSVFAVTRGGIGEGFDGPAIELNLPKQFVEQCGELAAT